MHRATLQVTNLKLSYKPRKSIKIQNSLLSKQDLSFLEARIVYTKQNRQYGTFIDH